MDWYSDVHGETLLTLPTFHRTSNNGNWKPFTSIWLGTGWYRYIYPGIGLRRSSRTSRSFCLPSFKRCFVHSEIASSLAFQMLETQVTFGFQWRIPENWGKTHSGWVSTTGSLSTGPRGTPMEKWKGFQAQKFGWNKPWKWRLWFPMVWMKHPWFQSLNLVGG